MKKRKNKEYTRRDFYQGSTLIKIIWKRIISNLGTKAEKLFQKIVRCYASNAIGLSPEYNDFYFFHITLYGRIVKISSWEQNYAVSLLFCLI